MYELRIFEGDMTQVESFASHDIELLRKIAGLFYNNMKNLEFEITELNTETGEFEPIEYLENIEE